MNFTRIGGTQPKEETLSPGLLRQRRNLIILSMFLILFDVATVHPEKLTIFGAELGLPKAGTYVFFAWLLLLYFVWRYYQYLREESDLGIKTGRLWRTAEDYLGPWAQRAHGECISQSQGSHGFERGASLKEWVFKVNPMIDGKRANMVVPIPPAQMAWALLRAAVHVTFRTSYVTDFLLPIGLAIAAPLFYIVAHT